MSDTGSKALRSRPQRTIGLARLTLACGILTLMASPVSSEPITFRFTARVDFSSRWPLLEVGDVIRGRLTFDSRLPDLVPEHPAGAFYADPTGTLTWSSARTGFQGRGELTIDISNSSSSFVDIRQYQPKDDPALIFDPQTNLFFNNYPDAPALPNDHLHFDADVLMGFPQHQWAYMEFNGTTEDFERGAFGPITSLTRVDSAAPVPEPATLLLLGIGGLGGLATIRRRR